MSRGPLEVLRDVAREYTAAVGDKHDVDEVDEAIAQVEALVRSISALPTQRGAQTIVFEGSDYVLISPDEFEALHEAAEPFTPGQDSEGGGHG